ncbi:MAG: alkaline phosphatase family protein [Gammaproteobacteria bacterium]|nr:alkaline phosphatase family protein [Gammaproteobacteria bacterium]MBU1406850.1 alkaline phosphatase family protein [Gammaproteobacteria bacterium]MBU1532993.1 alkaline phosphatase family protein [Gammaproteobacteria bacterium]
MDDPDLTLPDYQGGSLVNLMSSIATALGGSSAYAPATALPPEALADARHLVLLVIDGLGHDFLLGRDGALRQHLRGQLTSVFPSTTASAIPTFLTGQAPQQHGLTGWHMYFREIGAIAAPLPFRVRAGRHSLRQAGVTPATLFGLIPLFDRLPLPCHVVSPQQIIHSDFNVALSGKAARYGYDTLEDMFARIAGLLRSDAPRSYVHAYWPQLDSLAHEYGIGSPQVAEAFAALDAGFARLLAVARDSGSRVVVTADHGFIDTDETIDLDDHPALRDTLLLPLCGEPRMAYAYVRAGREAQFEAYVRGQLADRVRLYKSEDIVRQGWLGPGAAHPALRDRLGDYVLIPRGRAILRDWLQGEPRHTHIGVHGGLSAAEMIVPLIVAPLP